MFEDKTYENILADMLSRVTNDIDKREGSVIYDVLAPCAFKLAEAYFQLNNFIDLVSGDTAVGEYLDRVVADYGITRKPATYAIRSIKTTGPVDVGTRWGLDSSTYIITELISENEYKAQCEQIGSIGNRYTGILENIDNVSGVTATLTDIIISGTDEETDDDLRQRYFAKMRSPATSGNRYHYINWAKEVIGVGDAKCFPLWNGNGTIKVVIVNSDKRAANEGLITLVSNHIEENRPIGANVTVISATEKPIDITATVVLANGYTIGQVQQIFNDALVGYFKDIAFVENYVSYAKIGSILLSLPGIGDYTDLKVNGGINNVLLGDEEVPVLNTVTLGV